MKSPLHSITHHTARRFTMVVTTGLAVAMFAGASVTQAAQSDLGSTATNQAVSIASFAFAPAELSVPQGTAVTWTNAQDGVQHTTTSLDGVWDSGVLATNDSFSFTFNQPGDFTYQCSIHPSMRGIVHVVSDTDAQPATNPSVDAFTSAPTQTSAAAPATAASSAVTPTTTQVPTLAVPAAQPAAGQTVTPSPTYHY